MIPVIEIGSLAKLPGRAAKLRGGELSKTEALQLEKIVALLDDKAVRQAGELFKHAKSRDEAIHANSLFNIRLLESLGIGQVFDGEAHRTEMYEGLASEVKGMKRLDRQVSFANLEGHLNTFVPYMYVDTLSPKTPIHEKETAFILGNAQMPVKVPITGAYTMGTWSDLGMLPQEHRRHGLRASEARRKSTEHVVYEFAENVINPTIRRLAALGVARIQIDEPNASAFEGQEDILYEATRRSVAGVKGTELGMHICFSRDYATIAGVAKIPELRFITFELANRDDKTHKAYTDVVNAFEREGYSGNYSVGVINVHVDETESPELISGRLLHVAKLVGPERVEAAPDCGLRSRELPIAIKKLQALVYGARLAEGHL